MIGECRPRIDVTLRIVDGAEDSSRSTITRDPVEAIVCVHVILVDLAQGRDKECEYHRKDQDAEIEFQRVVHLFQLIVLVYLMVQDPIKFMIPSLLVQDIL